MATATSRGLPWQRLAQVSRAPPARSPVHRHRVHRGPPLQPVDAHIGYAGFPRSLVITRPRVITRLAPNPSPARAASRARAQGSPDRPWKHCWAGGNQVAGGAGLDPHPEARHRKRIASLSPLGGEAACSRATARRGLRAARRVPSPCSRTTRLDVPSRFTPQASGCRSHFQTAGHGPPRAQAHGRDRGEAQIGIHGR